MHVLLRNKKIRHKYEVLDTFTAGISLLGAEVKALKTQSATMDGSYVVIRETDGKYTVVLRGLSIPPYQTNNPASDYERERDRVLLLQKKEIAAIQRELHTKGVTVVPQSVGIERGKIKVQIALVRGLKKHDKRESIKKRDQQRDAARDSKARFA